MEFKQRLRTLWRDTTLAEQTLWQALHNPQQIPELLAHRFERHVVINDFFVDFVCFKLKLVIELQSNRGTAQVHSKSANERCTLLQYQGYLVVRVWQHDILNSLDTVLERLALIVGQRHRAQSQRWGG